jgi:protein TonB
MEELYLWRAMVHKLKKSSMEIKKSPKADLEGKRSTWLLIGYIFILAITFVAFEWSEREMKIDLNAGVADIDFEEEVIPITEQEQPKQAPPPPEAPKAEEVLEIVKNDANIQESTIQASDDTQKAVEVKYTPVQQVVEEEEPEEEQIFQVVEEMPEFPGGMAECLKFLSKNIKYPTISQENGVQGRVIIQFVVNRDGSIVDPQVVRGVDPYLDKEALRVVSSMPKWKPGKQRGKPVRVKYTVPVTFRLQ